MVTKRIASHRPVVALEDLPNIGKAMARDLRRIGVTRPSALEGQDPYRLYRELCAVTQTRQDPCVLDTFIAAVRFVEGAPARPWWAYTTERKRTLSRAAAVAAFPPRKRANRRELLGVTGVPPARPATTLGADGTRHR